MLVTGRVADFEVDPQRPNIYYVVTAAGGVWRSENRGNDWTSIFDNAGSFNMCCILIDPKDTERPVGRHGRELESAQLDDRRRRLQVHRRRQDLDARRTEELGAHRQHADGSAESERRLRGRAGSALVGRRRSRHLQDDRRRQELEADSHAGHDAGHRRQRDAHRSEQPRRALRLDVAAPARRRPDDRRRPGERHLQVHERRRDMGRTDEGPAEGRHGPHRDGRGSEGEAHARVRVDQRAGGHRVLSIR